MINAFKQIRLTNVNVSGQNGRIAVANSGNLAFTSELQAVESSLNSTISNLSGSLSSTIESNNSSFLAASGVLDSRITSEVSTLNSSLSSASGSLDSRITSEVSTLNNSLLAASGDLKSYVNSQISGVIDMAPEALNTLNELANALGDDASFASNLTNTLTNISGSLNSAITTAETNLNSNISTVSGALASSIASTGSNLQGQIDSLASTYVTLSTAQTISGDKTFAGNTSFAGGFEVNASQEGAAALFVSGSYVGINTEAPTEALDVNGNAKIGGGLFVGSGINANNKVISNVAAPVSGTDAVNKTYVDSVSGDLSTRLVSSGAALDSRITSEVSTLNSSLSAASGVLDSRITSEVSTLNSAISTASGALNSSLVAASGSLKSYVDSQISGVIDMAPEALNTLNELAAALGDDENFASNLTNTLTSVNSNVAAVSGALDSRITSEVSTLNSTISTASGALDSRITSEVSGLNSSLSSVSGVLQSAIDTKVASATQKQFSVLLPVGIETTGIVFPGSAFATAPTVQVTFEGDVIYQTVVKNRTVSGFDVYFSDVIQEEGSYLNVFASNQ
jgi:hypothetical protein